MSQYMFGTGQLFATPVGGGSPLRLGALQDVSVEFSGDIKQLFGQYQFPLATARGKTKIEGKIGTANIDVSAFNQLFFGNSLTNNSEKKQAIGEAGAVPSVSTYTITVANAASFFMDLGVRLVTTGLPLKQVASGPGAGEYSVDTATGIYTFNVAQAGAAVLIDYLYTATTTGSGSLEITNQLMGTTPRFQLVMSQVFEGKQFLMMLYSCVADKLSVPLKQDDFTVSEISYSAQANDANHIGFISTTSAVGGGA